MELEKLKDFINFMKEINFSPKIFFNSKRKNSIWEKDIEKRTLLNEIVKSYLN